MDQAETLMLTVAQTRYVIRALRSHVEVADLAFLERALDYAVERGRWELLLVIKK